MRNSMGDCSVFSSIESEQEIVVSDPKKERICENVVWDLSKLTTTFLNQYVDENVLIKGDLGSGKTTMIKNIIPELVKINKSILILCDVKEYQEYIQNEKVSLQDVYETDLDSVTASVREIDCLIVDEAHVFMKRVGFESLSRLYKLIQDENENLNMYVSIISQCLLHLEEED